jgi:two-component system cell cycle response regulator
LADIPTVKARVLLIEDNPENLELMRYLLSAFGHRPITATDGVEGIRLALAEPLDLVLCDIQMPGMDGYEVLRRLRANSQLKSTPIVAVTALAMVGDREKVLEAGFDAYLAKPIDPVAFVPFVDTLLAGPPRAAPPRMTAAVESSRPVSPPNGFTLLVVDDVQVNLDFAVSLFGPMGYRVLTATSHAQALRLARETMPDMILSDVTMPGGSGFDFLRDVKDDVALRRIPFIFITSTRMSESDRRKGLAMGAAEYLFRPIEPPAFAAQIERFLPKPAR